MRPFIDQADVYMKLDGTIAMWRGTPMIVNVLRTDPLHTVHISSLRRASKSLVVSSLDPSLELNSYNTGYFNRAEACYYVTRRPARVQKQGFHPYNILVDGRACNTDTRYMADMLQNKYPTLQYCFDKLRAARRGCTSQAFDKDYALAYVDLHQLGLYHSRRLIATHVQDNTFQLMDNMEDMRSFYMFELGDRIKLT